MNELIRTKGGEIHVKKENSRIPGSSCYAMRRTTDNGIHAIAESGRFEC